MSIIAVTAGDSPTFTLARGHLDTRFVNAREEVEKAALRLLLHVEKRPWEHMEERRTASPHFWCAHRVRHGLVYNLS